MKKIKTITLSLVLLLTIVAQGADQLVTTCVYCQQYTDSQGYTAPPKKNWCFCGSDTWQRGGWYVTTNVKDSMKALGLAQYQKFLRSIGRFGRVPVPNAISKVAPRFESPNAKSI